MLSGARRAPVAALLALALLGACVAPLAPTNPAPAASPAASASRAPVVPAPVADMTATLRAKPLPTADLFALTAHVRGRTGTPAGPFQPTRATPPDEATGAVERFWVYDFAAKRNDRVTATLRLLTEHGKWWVADGVSVDLAKLRDTAEVFETKLYPTDRRFYGSEWSPGIDADPRINILLANIPGAAAGYYSIADEEPRWLNEFSNEREMLYLNALSARLGTPALHSVIAHELCHMIQTNKRVPSVVWFVEGQAQLCESANGLGTGFEVAFLRRPDTQLDDWPDLDGGASAAYGGAYLFLEFLRQKAGGEELINAFLAQGIQTPDDLDRVLHARGQRALDELFADFVAANALVGSKTDERYTYAGPTTPRSAALVGEQDRVAATGTTLKATVHNYAARYIELPRAAVHLRLTAARASRVIPTDAHSGVTFWWSDRADTYDATLTRAVDLRTEASASLTFWTWYEIEKEYDYGYVEASTDGGVTWQTLKGTGTTSADPLGHNLGNGYTNVSGNGKEPAWVQERVDLTPYAGKEILVRFEYVTDEGRALGGFALDDIELSSGFRDDAEAGDAGWSANGFVRSTNVVAERWVVQVIRFAADRASVTRSVVTDGTLEFDLDASSDRRPPLLAVTPFAVRSVEPVPFEVVVEARR